MNKPLVHPLKVSRSPEGNAANPLIPRGEGKKERAWEEGGQNAEPVIYQEDD